MFGVIGDIHGDFDALARVTASRPDAAFWLSVGDVASDDLRYPDLAVPLYWIQGNNEDFEFIARLSGAVSAPGGLHFLPNGTVNRVDAVAVAALGGTFAPTWYETPAAALPFPRPPGARARSPRDGSRGGAGDRDQRAGLRAGTTRAVRDDKRRHFVREQVEALKRQGGVDVLLTHEAPRPYLVEAGARRIDAGKTVINELLAAMTPRLHFFGHHHRFSESLRQGVASIGLAVVSDSYVIVDADSFAWQKAESPKG